MQTKPLGLLSLAVVIGIVVWFAGPKGAEEPPEVIPSQVAGASPAKGAAPVQLRASVVARYAHDAEAFTQGLLWHDGKVHESSGHYGRSWLRRWDLETGEVEQETKLEADLFGEGLALVGHGAVDELLWLTWKAGRALRFDLDGFGRLGEFAYRGEGWGLTFCGDDLYRSDGTSTLWRHDPESFAVRGRIEVLRSEQPVAYLNELECTPRGILANVWQRDEILRIDPGSGRVTASIDAGGLLKRAERRPEAVLNGIAYRPETDTLLLTGKYWPWLFEVVLEEM